MAEKRRTGSLVVGTIILVLFVIFWLLIIVGIAEEPEDTSDIIIGAVALSIVPLALGVWLVVRGTSTSKDTSVSPWHWTMTRRRRRKILGWLHPGETVRLAVYVSSPSTRRLAVISSVVAVVAGVVVAVWLGSVLSGLVTTGLLFVIDLTVVSAMRPQPRELGILVVTGMRVIIIDRSDLSGGLTALRVDQAITAASIVDVEEGIFPVTTLLFTDGTTAVFETTRNQASRLAAAIA